MLTQAERTGQEDSYAVLHGLYWLTADIAQRVPLLLAVDDLHWADLPSQRFAGYLARRLDGLRVLLAVTVREPRAASAQDKALTAVLAAEPAVRTLRPAPLSADGCALLTAAALAPHPSPAFVGACHELTGGNPMLLHGLLATLPAEGVVGADADVPAPAPADTGDRVAARAAAARPAARPGARRRPRDRRARHVGDHRTGRPPGRARRGRLRGRRRAS